MLMWYDAVLIGILVLKISKRNFMVLNGSL